MAVIRTLIGNVKGVKGDTGATGAQGNAGEITVGSVTTGAYGTPASVVNSGTATNAILDFTIPQGAPGASVTDASPLVANSITTSIEQYPTYTAGETIATILGKIAKFLSDIRTNGLFKSNLVNGFTQTTPGVNALDAAAGKSLNDALATKAPTSHASSATTYGRGSSSLYGHVKLSDTYKSAVSGGNAAGGVGASQNALYNVYDAIENQLKMISLDENKSVKITFAAYATTALFFTTHNNSNYEIFLYANGYIAKNGSDTGLTATLSSDYKTITLKNTSSQFYYIGIVHPGTISMTVGTPY